MTVEAFAAEVGDHGPVAVEGGRTPWEAGGPLAEGTRVVQAPTGVVEHRPEEMTVRVRAGTPVAELAAVLAAAGQRAALPERGGTVGGAVVVGEDHLDVRLRGRVRASVLQVRYVAHDGRVVSGGGPTVKNVTGYDLPRLLAGSLGTLGLVAEVILRTNPVPPASVWLRAEGVDPFALPTRGTVLWGGARTWVHLEGHAVDVAAQRVALPGSWEEVEGPPPLPPHRWSLRPSDLRSTRPAGRFVASVGVGLLCADEPQPSRPLDPRARSVAARAKALFDPTGRLNPGRDPARR